MLIGAANVLVDVLALTTALAFAGLAMAAMVRRRPFTHPAYPLALVVISGWLLTGRAFGVDSAATQGLEAVSNLLLLWFLSSLAERERGTRRVSSVGWIYIGLFAVQLVVVAALVLPLVFGVPATVQVTGFEPANMLVTAGALVLLHNVFDASRGDERQQLTWPLTALMLHWVYALNINAITLFSGEPAGLLQMLRPAVMALVAVMLAVAVLRPASRAVHLSRPVVFRSLAMAAVCGWLALLAALAMVLPATGQTFGGWAQAVVIAATVPAAGLFLLSAKVRAYVRVWAAKHFYEHRYDYRAEWLRFTATLNQEDASHHAIDVRVVKSIADMVESPAGLLVSQSSGQWAVTAVWPTAALQAVDADWRSVHDWLAESGRIIQIDEIRSGAAPPAERAAVPAWMTEDARYWIIVPLAHGDGIEAFLVLTRPLVNRALDWEDFDLLRIAGRQAASHIAESRGSEALAESARFEEFHRRFAFMMHDVKNLASQMALLSHNAERHGDKPAFREDMVATLQLCAERLSQLMRRLSQQERVRVDRLVPVDLAVVARQAATARRAQHPVEVGGCDSAVAWGDADTVGQLLTHLIQNAIDASPADSAVRLVVEQDAVGPHIRVIDDGCGMSPEFVRTKLFRPFSSTKDDGFGIGTYQARQLAEAMGGSIEVTSREGAGSTFTLRLRAWHDETGTSHTQSGNLPGSTNSEAA